jgi:hypothetical protein
MMLWSTVNIVAFVGVLTVHAVLEVPNAAAVEDELEARFREFRKRATREEQQELLSILGAKLIDLKKSKSVAVFIHCTTLSAVQFLNSSLEDGTLKSVVEDVFNRLLKGCRGEIRILQCSVTNYNYNCCLNYFHESLGLSTALFIL